MNNAIALKTFESDRSSLAVFFKMLVFDLPANYQKILILMVAVVFFDSQDNLESGITL